MIVISLVFAAAACGARGVGEMALRHRSGGQVPGSDSPPNDPDALPIYDAAAARGVP